MHFSTLLLPSLALLSSTSALMKGFNIGANRASDGACKTQTDWTNDFKAMQAINPGSGRLKFTYARVYAASDCNTLANAVPAAIATNTKLLVGIWTEDATHYNNEKQALLAVSKAHGVAWIAGISVGSEDLYRKDTTASALVSQIYDVRGMMTTVPGGSTIKIGHVDTWTAWVDGANTAVIKACDWIGTDGYPYWQGDAESQGYNVFIQSVNNVKTAVANAGSKAPVYVTETGWPITGPSDGSGVPSKAAASDYYQKTACAVFRLYDTFYYTLQDYNASPSFGVMGPNYAPLYSLTCSS